LRIAGSSYRYAIEEVLCHDARPEHRRQLVDTQGFCFVEPSPGPSQMRAVQALLPRCQREWAEQGAVVAIEYFDCVWSPFDRRRNHQDMEVELVSSVMTSNKAQEECDRLFPKSGFCRSRRVRLWLRQCRCLGRSHTIGCSRWWLRGGRNGYTPGDCTPCQGDCSKYREMRAN